MSSLDSNGNVHDDAGRFSEKSNSAPAQALSHEEPQSGSFLFPPASFANADELFNFFDTVPISDRILSNVTHAQEHWRNEEINKAVREQYRVYGNDPKVVREAKVNPELSDRKAREFVSAVRREEEAKRPAHALNPGDVRSIIVARQLDFYRHTVVDLKGTDTDWVLERELPVYGGSRSARQLLDDYEVHEWARRALTESDLAVIDSNLTVAKIIDAKDGIWDVVYT